MKNVYTGLEFDYDPNDYPDFCDTYVTGGFVNGKEMTEGQLEELNDDRVLVHDLLREFLF